MPELPEVETIRRGLSRLLPREPLRRVEILCAKSWREVSGGVEKVVGATVTATERRGKALLLRLSNGYTLMIHLRMTGQLIYVAEGLADGRFAAGHPDASLQAEMPDGHTRVFFEFADGSRLFFNDLRKFGFVAVMDEQALAKDRFLQKLGPEPWEADLNKFFVQLQRHARAPIKAVILDQSVLAGVGNIYADEGCFRAGIYPGRLAGSLSRTEAQKLLAGLSAVMQQAIDSGGSTLRDYVQADGARGNYLEKFALVFRREKQPCKRCGTLIEKTRVAGRGTHFCPHCQPRKGVHND